jgi:hypothetical protein
MAARLPNILAKSFCGGSYWMSLTWFAAGVVYFKVQNNLVKGGAR